MIPRENVEPYLSGGRSMKFVGPHRGFSRYGIRRGTLINCVALAKADAWRQEGWSHPCSRDELLELYQGFHRDVIGLIENAPENNIFKWALYDREPLTNWTVGRATLLGDAAHPMLPYLAQGATAAIEDALVLARALEAHDDHASAFAVYQANRIPRTTTQMRSSRDQAAALDQADPYRYAARRSDPAAMNVYDPVTVPV
jgi:salicylate hydroxylase